jgi:hypothetical protein
MHALPSGVVQSSTVVSPLTHLKRTEARVLGAQKCLQSAVDSNSRHRTRLSSTVSPKDLLQMRGLRGEVNVVGERPELITLEKCVIGRDRETHINV